jgi:hypothetical protein
MSNFLEVLAARQIAAGSMIEPHLASAFEAQNHNLQMPNQHNDPFAEIMNQELEVLGSATAHTAQDWRETQPARLIGAQKFGTTPVDAVDLPTSPLVSQPETIQKMVASRQPESIQHAQHQRLSPDAQTTAIDDALAMPTAQARAYSASSETRGPAASEKFQVHPIVEESRGPAASEKRPVHEIVEEIRYQSASEKLQVHPMVEQTRYQSASDKPQVRPMVEEARGPAVSRSQNAANDHVFETQSQPEPVPLTAQQGQTKFAPKTSRQKTNHGLDVRTEPSRLEGETTSGLQAFSLPRRPVELPTNTTNTNTGIEYPEALENFQHLASPVQRLETPSTTSPTRVPQMPTVILQDSATAAIPARIGFEQSAVAVTNLTRPTPTRTDDTIQRVQQPARTLKPTRTDDTIQHVQQPAHAIPRTVSEQSEVAVTTPMRPAPTRPDATVQPVQQRGQQRVQQPARALKPTLHEPQPSEAHAGVDRPQHPSARTVPEPKPLTSNPQNLSARAVPELNPLTPKTQHPSARTVPEPNTLTPKPQHPRAANIATSNRNSRFLEPTLTAQPSPFSVEPSASSSIPASVERTVQITIGRLEVRLNSTAAAQPRASRTSKVIGLEDYLAQRSRTRS